MGEGRGIEAQAGPYNAGMQHDNSLRGDLGVGSGSMGMLSCGSDPISRHPAMLLTCANGVLYVLARAAAQHPSVSDIAPSPFAPALASAGGHPFLLPGRYCRKVIAEPLTIDACMQYAPATARVAPWWLPRVVHCFGGALGRRILALVAQRRATSSTPRASATWFRVRWHAFGLAPRRRPQRPPNNAYLRKYWTSVQDL